MTVIEERRQISIEERDQIDKQVKAELIDHLYQGCLPGTISGVPVGIAIFIDYYSYSSTYWLISWFIFYNFSLVLLTTVYFFYKRHTYLLELNNWLIAYAIVMSICALCWGMSVFLIPDNITHQYFAFIALFLIATGYATGSIGVFELCVATLAIIITPLIIWCFLKGGIFYNLLGFFAMIYIGFMLSINRRSTMWFKDSLKLKLENTLVSYQANHDVLTDLPNQRLLPQYVESAINFAKSTNTTFALVSFSLNRMEVINDSLGHKAGDSIIQSVANRLTHLATQASKIKDNVKYIITISRKDTFNILLLPLRENEVVNKIKTLFSVLDDHFYLETKGIKMTASLGASLYPIDGQSADTLLIKADAAMLQAKQFGGNRLEFYRSEINAQILHKLELENDLNTALKNKELLLYYQPLVDIASQRICGMEALLRWPHPTQGFISPMHFIPVAEETGLIIPIGEWVLEEACRQTLIWHQMGFTWLKVAVNLSEKQLRDEKIIETIQRILLNTNYDPSLLELELTETSILDESIIPTIQAFKQMGLSLAVDDFGTGYSGLSYLKRFSIDKLKIDQSFIRDIPSNNDSIAIVSAILAMAKELRIKTLAEGVETEDQLQFLRKRGCDYAQGYYFSKPLEATFFTQLLLSQPRYVLDSALETVSKGGDFK